ncbi:hypothetical protein BDZ91DRAFT_324298 [Kalaharituber pfeilii]|nr:hypothetical protein BDZ91DRAFT_324298 [Kalaharituber pfeilii]
MTCTTLSSPHCHYGQLKIPSTLFSFPFCCDVNNNLSCNKGIRPRLTGKNRKDTRKLEDVAQIFPLHNVLDHSFGCPSTTRKMVHIIAIVPVMPTTAELEIPVRSLIHAQSDLRRGGTGENDGTRSQWIRVAP